MKKIIFLSLLFFTAIVVAFTGCSKEIVGRTDHTPALSPAKITSVKIDDETKRAEVFLKPDQVSLAIGKGGHNIKLAGKLTGYEIDVYRDSEDEDEDVDLEEFSDEIEPWVIEAFKKIGCDTARSVLELNAEELERRTDLEKETINDVLRILREEFEKE